MKKSLVFLLIMAILCVSIPFSVSADDADVYVGGVAMSDGDYLANGATSTTKTKPAESGYAYFKDGVLTLNYYDYTGEGYSYQLSPDEEYTYPSCIFSPSDLVISLEGVSYLENTAEEGECISIDGNLTIKGDDESGIKINGYYGIYAYSLDSDISLTFDSGILYATGTYGIMLDGYYSDAKLTVNGGILGFETDDIAISVYSEYDTYIEINGGEIGTMSAVYSYSYLGTADITINRGALYAVSENIAIVSYSEASDGENILSTVHLNNGDLYAYGQYCGVYADELFVLGGEFRVAYDPEAYPEGALYSGGITAVDGMGEIGTTIDSEYGIGVYEMGDVNSDLKVDASDYLIVKRLCFGSYKLWGSENLRADIDENETINATDYLLIKRICFNTYSA